MKIKSLVIAMSLATVSGLAWAGDYNAEAAATSSTAMVADDSMYQDTIDGMNQVADRNAASLGMDWSKYVSIHGGIFVDGVWGAKSLDFAGENSKAMSVTNAYMSLEVTPNDWTKVDMTANYSDADSSYITGSDDTAYIDQAFVTFGNADRYPVFVQLGRQYAPFGRYDISPVVKSLGQMLSETNQTEAQVGFVVPKGLYGSVYTFQNGVNKDETTGTDPFNYGANIGFKKSNDKMSLDVGVGYMYNMTGVQAIEDYVDGTGAYSNSASQGFYNDEVSAMSPYVSFETGPFSVDVDYVSALETFEASTLSYQSGEGAKPAAFDTKFSYSFSKMDMDQEAFLGYSHSYEASALDLPEARVSLGYNVYPWENVMFGLEIDRDTAYDAQYTVTDANNDGDDYYTYNLRAGVMF